MGEGQGGGAEGLMKENVLGNRIGARLVMAGHFFSYYMGGLVRKFAEHHVLLLSGGIAFSVFLCVIPLVLVVFSLLGSLLEAASIKRQIDVFLGTAIPYPEYNAWVKRIIFSRVDEIVAHKKIAGYVGGAGLLLAASGLFSSMRTVLHMIFGIRGRQAVLLKRLGDYALGKIRDLLMVLLVLAFFLISALLLPVLEIAQESAQRVRFLQHSDSGIPQRLSSSLASLPLAFCLFFVIYYLIPVENIGKRTAVVSAFWAAILWELAKQGFGYYTASVASPGQIFGAYVVLVVIALWISWCAVVFIVGAVTGQLSRERRASREGVRERA